MLVILLAFPAFMLGSLLFVASQLVATPAGQHGPQGETK